MRCDHAGVRVLAVVALFSPLAFATVNTNGEKGLVRTLSAQPQGKLKLNIAAGANYATGKDYIKGPDGDPRPHKGGSETYEVLKPAHMLSSNLSTSIGILSFWDLSLSLPFYYDWLGVGDLKDGGLGDLEISTKLSQPAIGKILFQSFYVAGTVPVGMDRGLMPRNPSFFRTSDTSRASATVSTDAGFYTYGMPSIKGMLLWTLDFSEGKRKVPVALHLNVGGLLTTKNRQNTAIGAFGFEVSPRPFVTIFLDAWAEVRWSSFDAGIDLFRDPLFISPGIRITTPTGLYIQAAGDFSLSSQKDEARKGSAWTKDDYIYSTTAAPMFGVQFQIGWTSFLTPQDDDRDGIKNDADRCPKDAEDVDGFQDSDGCPDLDNDNDGVPDLHDKCPGDAEDRDGFQDEDGCPDPDNDKDGLADIRDKCPNEAEDFDGFDDKDGCLDPDNDRDGIPDSLDKCPNDPEDFDQFEDNDGCPDVDNDKDGISDLKDKCPNEPEVFNGVADDDGCPDAKKRECDMPKQQIIRGIKFVGATSDMAVESFRYLEPIVKTLKDYTDVEIEVRGHTDSLGKYAANMKLSQTRAESVRQYLISQGIRPERIRAVGFGPSSPIADNRTAAGRAENKRVEIVRIK